MNMKKGDLQKVTYKKFRFKYKHKVRRKLRIRWMPHWKIKRIIRGRRRWMMREKTIRNTDLMKRWFMVYDYCKDLVRSMRVMGMYYLVFKEVTNNIMGTLVDGKGRVLIKKTSGEVGLKGSKRNSSYAAHMVGASIGFIARRRGITRVSVRIRGRVTNKFKLFLRGFFKVRLRSRMRLSKVEYRYRHTHESFKVKKVRRV